MKSDKLKSITILSLFLLFYPGCGSCNSSENIKAKIKEVFKGYSGEHLIYINKKNFILYLYDRNLNVIANYKIGYGLNPDKKAKLYAGDNRTPEGVYRITEILSMDADKNSIAFKKLKKMNSVYFRAKDGHFKFCKRDEDLGDNAYGPRFFRIDYPNRDDVSKYNDAIKEGMISRIDGKIPSIGSGIAIHGNNDRDSIGELASNGCIRMYNEDIIELGNYIKLNMPVIISYGKY